MKILLVVHQLPPRHEAGTEVYTTRLAAALRARHTVLRFAADDDPLRKPGSVATRCDATGDIVELAVDRVVREPSDAWTSARADAAFASVLAEFRPDVVHFQHLQNLGLGLPRLAKSGSAATVWTLHDYWLACAREGQLVTGAGARCPGPGPAACTACLQGHRAGLSAWEARAARVVAAADRRLRLPLAPLARMAGLALRRARRPDLETTRAAEVAARAEAVSQLILAIDRWIAPSVFARQVHCGVGVPAGRVSVIPHGLDAVALRPSGPERLGSPLRIGYLGTVAPPKGVDVLVDAVASLRAGQATLDVFGRDDIRPEYTAALKQRARGAAVTFHGAFAPAAAAAALARIDVAVVPSRWDENAPLTVLDAFAAGVPVVASAVGGLPELVHDGVNGRLFAAGDVPELTAILRDLAEHPPALARLRAGVTPPPTMAVHVHAVESVYAAAMGRGS